MIRASFPCFPCLPFLFLLDCAFTPQTGSFVIRALPECHVRQVGAADALDWSEPETLRGAIYDFELVDAG